jgi:peptidoglycan hydrolase-like protein with peptidoglycan-binding domain
MDGGKVLGEEQPGLGDDSQRQSGDEGSGGEPQPQTAAEILGQSQAAQGRRGIATRVGFTASVIAAVAVAVGIGALAVVASTKGSHGAAGNARAVGAQAKGTADAAPLRIVAVSPATKSKHVNGDTTVQIAFSSRVASSVVPAFRPAVRGHWQASGSMLSFTPSTPFAPSTRYTLVIPGGRRGLRSAAGGLLAKPRRVSFQTGGYSQIRLAEVLSQLGYLPMTWQATGGDGVPGMPASGGDANGGVANGGTGNSGAGNSGAGNSGAGNSGAGNSGAGNSGAANSVAGQEKLAYSPPRGTFTWKAGYPASLRAAWVPGHPNVVVRGAVMAFQAQHRLAVNGIASKKLWSKLFAAAASSERNTVGYSYAIASKGSPETLTIWHDGHKVLRTLVNTGISIDPTASGTYPVYLRYRFQIMQGTNPDGSHYADPVSYVSYFDGGEAVHYFPRGSYGFPQSLGCVELPLNDAKRAWPYLTYGSLVTVIS